MKQFRYKGCPMFNELEIIHGDTTATGENAEASTQGATNTDDENVIPPTRGECNQDHHVAINLDDDTDFAEETYV